MPPHLVYCEPYAGGLAVLLEKDPLDPKFFYSKKSYEQGVSEVVNDLHQGLTNFWRVLQNDEAFASFLRRVEATPFSQVEWDAAEDRQLPEDEEPDYEAAANFFVRCRQSRAGSFKSFATLSRNRTRRRMSEQASAWMTAIDGLPEVAARLKRVVILNTDALTVIRAQDGPRTLFYLDPPYLHETRTTTSAYDYEMSMEEHVALLEVLQGVKGKVLLSGYANKLYSRTLAKWQRHDFAIDNKMSSKKSKNTMVESVWTNF